MVRSAILSQLEFVRLHALILSISTIIPSRTRPYVAVVRSVAVQSHQTSIKLLQFPSKHQHSYAPRSSMSPCSTLCQTSLRPYILDTCVPASLYDFTPSRLDTHDAFTLNISTSPLLTLGLFTPTRLHAVLPSEPSTCSRPFDRF